MASTSRRTSGTVSGIRPGSAPPFPAGLFPPGGLARDDQVGVRQQAERGVAVPGVPFAHLVLVQADLPLRLRQALLDLPAASSQTRTNSSTAVSSGP